MYDTSRSIAEILTLLEAAPARLAGITGGLEPAQLVAPPAPGEWSVRDVLAHLRSCCDVWGRAIVEILREEHPTIKAVNPRTWIEKTDYLEQDFRRSLDAFTNQRAELMTVLKPLSPDDWSRKARVTGAGKPLERTVYTYAQWLANHERPHIKQIERIAVALRTNPISEQ